MSQRIFISYSRNDADFANRLAADLKQRGADVWIDTSEIRAGAIWSDAIEEGLKSAALMLLIHSPTSYASRNVRNEWHHFLDNNKPIIPILWLPTEVHFQLGHVQWVDFHSLNYDIAFEKLWGELSLKGSILPNTTARAPILPQGKITPVLAINPILSLISLIQTSQSHRCSLGIQDCGTLIIIFFTIGSFTMTSLHLDHLEGTTNHVT